MAKTRTGSGGGSGISEVFDITSNSVNSTEVIVLDLLEGTTIPSDIVLFAGRTLTPQNIANDSGLATFVKDYCDTIVEGGEEVNLEEGGRATAPIATEVPLAIIAYGPTVGGKVQTFVVCVGAQSDGDMEWKDKTFARRPVKFVSQLWNGSAALTVPTACFNSAYVDLADTQIAADAVSIPVGSIGFELWLDAA